ncbi:MAG TPA: pirin family protein [Vicinamibacteria bacterium]|nr:pirin family protein [Vicinamibacteria bacterium]
MGSSAKQTARASATTRVRRAGERGHTDWGWLDSRHTFAFGDYHDPLNMGFRTLRVLNDDRVTAGSGFGTHGHSDMEILSYVLEGALEHKDSMGTGSVIRPGEIQLMRAGTGVTHSEYNASRTEPLHFLQIWILPDRRGLAPEYDQKPVDHEAARRGFALLASKDGRQGSLRISQDVDLWLALLEEGERRELKLNPGRHAWVQLARGSVALDAHELGEGDGAALSGAEAVRLTGKGPAEVLVFDLA